MLAYQPCTTTSNLATVTLESSIALLLASNPMSVSTPAKHDFRYCYQPIAPVGQCDQIISGWPFSD